VHQLDKWKTHFTVLVLQPLKVSLCGQLKIRTSFRSCEFSLEVRWPSHDGRPARCTITTAHVRPKLPAPRRWDSKPESQGFIRSNPPRTLWSSVVSGLRPGLASNKISRTVTTCNICSHLNNRILVPTVIIATRHSTADWLLLIVIDLKCKVKFTLEHAKKAQRESRGIGVVIDYINYIRLISPRDTPLLGDSCWLLSIL